MFLKKIIKSRILGQKINLGKEIEKKKKIKNCED